MWKIIFVECPPVVGQGGIHRDPNAIAAQCAMRFFSNTFQKVQGGKHVKVKKRQRQNHRLIKTQIGHARDFTWYRGQRPSPARVILSHERVQIHALENLCSYATNPPHFRVRELLLCDILITPAGDGRWPRYQAKSLACPGCGQNILRLTRENWF